MFSIKKLKDIRLFRKITLAYVFFILIPILGIYVFNYFQIREKVENEAVNKGLNTILQMRNNISNKIKVIESISDNICYNTRLYSFLQTDFHMTPESYLEYSQHIYPLVNYAMIFHKVNIQKINIYMNNTTIPEAWDIFLKEERIQSQYWYRQFIESDDKILWINEDNMSVYILVKKIFSLDNQYLGLAAFEVLKKEMLSAVIDVFDNNEYVYILGNNNDVLYSSQRMEDDVLHKLISRNQNMDYEGHYILDNSLFVFGTIQPPGIKIALKHIINRNNSSTKSIFTVIGFLIFFTILLISLFYMILRSIFYKINYNIKAVNDIIEDGFKNRIQVNRKDEIGQIATKFNLLIDRINMLVKDIVIKETAQKDAQLKALQMQINPHFIYNTIDIFRMSIELKGNYEVADGIARFGQLLRYNMDISSMFTTLTQEIQYIRDYIEIQKIRYDNRIILNIDLPPELSEYRMIKFVFQPVVENSIIHGLKGIDDKLVIDLFFYVDRENIMIIARDNGQGISEETLAIINQQLRHSEYKEDHSLGNEGIGLKNINERLKLFYGEQYFIQLNSIQGEYTEIILKVPHKPSNFWTIEPK